MDIPTINKSSNRCLTKALDPNETKEKRKEYYICYEVYKWADSVEDGLINLNSVPEELRELITNEVKFRQENKGNMVSEELSANFLKLIRQKV